MPFVIIDAGDDDNEGTALLTAEAPLPTIIGADGTGILPVVPAILWSCLRAVWANASLGVPATKTKIKRYLTRDLADLNFLNEHKLFIKHIIYISFKPAVCRNPFTYKGYTLIRKYSFKVIQDHVSFQNNLT